MCIIKQRRQQELEKSKQIKLITKHLCSTHSTEQEAPPPTFLLLGDAEQTHVEETPVAGFDVLLG